MNTTLTKIRSILDQRGWSLYKLAQQSGIPYSSLSTLFRKNNCPSIPTLEKICNGLKISLAEFFSDDPPFREIDIYSDDEKALIRNCHALSSNDKKLLANIATLLLQRSNKSDGTE